MDITGICTQIMAIAGYVSGINQAFNYDELPGSLNREDLPAAVPVIGPTYARQYFSSRQNEAIEAQEYNVIVYVLPQTQGYSIGEAVSTAADIIGPFLNAYQSRPRLQNADGASPDDFDSITADLTSATIDRSEGIVRRGYGEIIYFALEFTITCNGKRETTKVSET
jgi:hypothetical protein